MVLIKHVKGGVSLPKYDIHFPKGEAVEITDSKLAERILRNKDFQEIKTKKEAK
ncbi:MAG: hypothetical protein AB1467_06805 [Candidatus Diapherotrites archaeon]